jgi:polar amino acid transport system permease protein
VTERAHQVLIDDPGDLPLVRRRHPGRWLAAALVLFILGSILLTLASTETLQWNVVGDFLFSDEVLKGVRNTILMTILCMVIGIVLGTLIAVMRLSPNPVLTGVAALYQWFFRGTPTLVQLIFWFNLSSIFPYFYLQVGGVELVDIDTNAMMTPLVAAILGLGLNFGAYYSEVVRAGILSVDEGQSDAAAAYGLSRYQTLRRIVLPQAMRVIIPPTGNELIGMLKWTSLASIVGYTELLRTVGNVYNVTYQVIPLLIVAALWYLFMTSVLTVGQHFVEKRFARGTTRSVASSPSVRLWRRLKGKTVNHA